MPRSNLSLETLHVLEDLRPPLARNGRVLSPFSTEGAVNYGLTLEVPTGEFVTAPGVGRVVRIHAQPPEWSPLNSSGFSVVVYYVTLDHGYGVTSLLGGLSSVLVNLGQQVFRGQVIGVPLLNQLFVRINVYGNPVNPVQVNPVWKVLNAAEVPRFGGFLRYGPDMWLRALGQQLSAFYYNRFAWFQRQDTKFLLNIDFNGTGDKWGFAAVGFKDTDYWNVCPPTSLTAQASPDCAYGPLNVYGYWFGQGEQFATLQFISFNNPPLVCLKNHLERQSPVALLWLANLNITWGNAPSWDTMLGTWIGGYDFFGQPEIISFCLVGVPAGNYQLYLYANNGVPPNTSIFQVAVYAAYPQIKTLLTTSVPAFVENANYARFNLSLAQTGRIYVRVAGYLSGLQLVRV